MPPPGVYCNHKNLIIQKLEQMPHEELPMEILQQDIDYDFQHTHATI
jgi:hypothetical protein